MDIRSLFRSLWTWFVLAVVVTALTIAVSNATGTAGDGNDSGVAEVANVVGLLTMIAALPLLVGAVVQTARRRR